jgi:hypothetical protein
LQLHRAYLNEASYLLLADTTTLPFWQFFLSSHFPILFCGQKAFYPIHDHRMVAYLAAIATGVYAVPCLTMATCLACAYMLSKEIASLPLVVTSIIFHLLHTI